MDAVLSCVKVTIVIPLYQVEEYIEASLLSVANQTYKGPIECIIIDDCGTDNSCRIVETFMSEYKGGVEFRLLHHDHNRGLSAARNTGMDHASGEYIYFLDSDDEITPDCIEKLTKPLESYRYDFVIADFSIVGGYPITTYLKARGEYKSGIKEAYYRKEWNVTAWNKLCNLDFLKRVALTFKEGIIHEDVLWSFYLANYAQSMYALTEKTYIYKLRESSIMGQMKFRLTKSMDSYMLIYTEINNFLLSRDIYEKETCSYIWRINDEMFNDLRGWEFKDSRPYMLELISVTKVNPIRSYLLECLSFKNLIKNLYLVLPVNIASFYYYIINETIKIMASLALFKK